MKNIAVRNSKGISVLFLVIAMLLMVAIGYVFSYLISGKQKSDIFPIQSTQAYFIAQSGVEFAVKYACTRTPPWTTPALLNGLDSMTRSFGAGRFVLDYDSVNNRLICVGEVPTGTERRRIVVSNFTSSLMSISYFASASTPIDGGFNTANPTAVTPPAGMQAGDLVLMIGLSRDNTATLAISNAGGQSWTSEAQQNGNTCRLRLFWCRFNGTWTANPSVSFGNTNPHIVVMHVFRPSNTSSVWEVDVAQVSNTFPAPPAPNHTVTIPGITTITDGALVFATWASRDNNTWGNLTAGWTTPGSAQYRNSSGNDQSQTHAYRVMTIAGATGNVSKDETGSGGGRYEPGVYLIIAFRARVI
ncbi:MAG: hypothetical protein HXY46_00095 [Syntrophaceae bacterium]|nr:hypothetical protein [Syntrophaceae bacterium]